jgi:hypothetical protein
VLNKVCFLLLGFPTACHPHLQQQSRRHRRGIKVGASQQMCQGWWEVGLHACMNHITFTLCWSPHGPASMNSQMGQPGVETSEVPPLSSAAAGASGAVGTEVAGVSDILLGSLAVAHDLSSFCTLHSGS